ncbi:MAG: hypothetical protein ACREP2_05030 [Rhodanobacteraceae bacterium]
MQTPDMNTVIRLIRQTRSLAIETLQRDYPDLYALSVPAFEQPAGSIPHHQRLGEFLTEWDNGLGRSPAEALAMGQRDEVKQILQARAGIEEGDD